MSLKQNIIYIYFKGKHQVTSKSQYQYNRGQYLYFADLNLPQAFEVHFSNKDKGASKTQIGSDNLVEIPDEYFWNGALQIYAWIYLHSKITDGETIYEVRIPLTKRAKPTDEEPLPVQQSTIDRAIAELNNAVDITTENANKTESDKTIVANIKEDVVDLKEEINSTATTINQKAQETIDAAERGKTSAQNAATSERQALNYSQQAEQSAQDALESKNIAQQKSEVATNASNEALGYRNEALEAKDQAVQAKQNIVNYRDETKGYRDETLALKNNVTTLKEQIDDISDAVDDNAQIAHDSMVSANNASQSASQYASSASQSASQAEQSAQTASAKADAITGLTATATTLPDGSSATANYNPETGVMSFGIPRGINGINGDDGYSPTANVSKTGKVATITITDQNGTTSARVEDGENGTDGISPTVTITPITGGHRITITDADGEHSADVMDGTGSVDDVQINGSSIVTDGVANVPKATPDVMGAMKIGSGLLDWNNNGTVGILRAYEYLIKAGADLYRPIVPVNQHQSTFYGLAKAAGHDEKNSTLPVGEYTEDAKSAISEMLGGSVSVSGTTPTIVAKSGIRYVCGEVATLDFTPSASGICDIIFTSGTTATVLTLPNTVKMPSGFGVNADTVYELNFLNGLGVYQTWAVT